MTALEHHEPEHGQHVHGGSLATYKAVFVALCILTTMSFMNEPRSEEGDSPADCAKRLVDAGADIVGVNCLRPPEHTLPLAIEMRGAVPGAYVAAQPVAYRTPAERPDFTSLPQFPYDLDPLQLTRKDFADYAKQALDAGIDYIGACCGAVAEHVRAMAKAIGRLPSQEREWRSPTGKPMSGYEYYGHEEKEPG